MIDDDPISVDELIDAWKVVKGKDEDVRHFRFHILMLTKVSHPFAHHTHLHRCRSP